MDTPTILPRPNPNGAARIGRLKRIAVHSMSEWLFDKASGRALHAAEFLERLGLSAHVLVTPTGQLIRCRQDDQGAYHAKGFNTGSLSIEVLVPGMHDLESFYATIADLWVPAGAFSATIWQVRTWLDQHGALELARHSDLDPDRKKDPGAGFPWSRMLEEVAVCQLEGAG